MALDDGHTDFSQGHDACSRRLTETDLAARRGTSHTPAREAIRLLESDGLVTQTTRAGAVIRQLDYAEITELYEMRGVLEGTAASFAARAACPSEVALRARDGDAAEAAMRAHIEAAHKARQRQLRQGRET